MSTVRDFIIALLCAAEKAARIARECRSNHALFALLVEEKHGDSANKRFSQDFKTLGDVLIQESVRHELASKFPEMRDYVYGEENNQFTNSLGETVILEVQHTPLQTAALLLKVLDGNTQAADALAAVVHSHVPLSSFDPDGKLASGLESRRELSAHFRPDNIGIWIDPIDGTNEYIAGNRTLPDPATLLYPSGLPTCLVLIGAFDRGTGVPVAGVMCQPFHPQEGSTVLDGQFVSRHIWGIDIRAPESPVVASNALEYRQLHRERRPNPGLKVVTMSGSESEAVRKEAAKRGIHIQVTSGAGYKLLAVVDGLADAYFLSKGSTYKWDTCGPHAILRAIAGTGGAFARPLSKDATAQLAYHVMDDPAKKSWANSTGVLAVASSADYAEYSFFWDC